MASSIVRGRPVGILAVFRCNPLLGTLAFLAGARLASRALSVRVRRLASGSTNLRCGAVGMVMLSGPIVGWTLFLLRACLRIGQERVCFALFARSLPAVAIVFLCQVRLKAGHLRSPPLEPDLAQVPRESVSELLAL